jgi:hypothetical protein
MHDEPLPPGQDGQERPGADQARSGTSLTDDLVALLEDGKAYLEAEAAYQKSRAGFVADKGKWGIVHGLAAFALVHIALIGLVVGVVIALSRFLTIWGATAAVTGVLLLGGYLFARSAIRHFKEAGASFGDDSP